MLTKRITEEYIQHIFKLHNTDFESSAVIQETVYSLVKVSVNNDIYSIYDKADLTHGLITLISWAVPFYGRITNYTKSPEDAQKVLMDFYFDTKLPKLYEGIIFRALCDLDLLDTFPVEDFIK